MAHESMDERSRIGPGTWIDMSRTTDFPIAVTAVAAAPEPLKRSFNLP